MVQNMPRACWAFAAAFACLQTSRDGPVNYCASEAARPRCLASGWIDVRPRTSGSSHPRARSTPLAVRNGHIKRLTDQDIQSSVLEIMSTNVTTTYITCPADPNKTLGIKLPFLVMIIKNLKKYFSFEVQVLDDKNVRRRFRASNYQVRSEPHWGAQRS